MNLLIRLTIVLLYLASGCTADKMHDASISLSCDSLELFAPGLISTSMFERDFAMDRAGKEIYFTLGNLKQTQRNIVHLRRDEQGRTGENWLFDDNKYQDIEPFLSPDGERLYFASNRPIYNDTQRTDYNIWYIDRLDAGWSAPLALDTMINGLGDEFYPSVSQNGNLYFTAARNNGIGREDIFVAKRQGERYLPPQALDTAINSGTFEFNAYINKEENLIIFSSYGREDGMGGGDLYFSRKDDYGNWNTAINLGPDINSNTLDFCPFVDEN